MDPEAMARYGQNWVARWRDLVNTGPMVPFIGKFFTCDFLLGFGEKEYLVHMHKGRIDELEYIDPDLGATVLWQFALRAPVSLWDKFLADRQPPGCWDIWGMSFRPAHPEGEFLALEGDLVPLWQNNRSVQRMLDTLRRV